MSPTITLETGVIIGTAAYMSPEQARGQAVDKRADVWAFGCVLYELLTGRLAFAAATVTDTLAAVLHQRAGLDGAASGIAAGGDDAAAAVPGEGRAAAPARHRRRARRARRRAEAARSVQRCQRPRRVRAHDGFFHLRWPPSLSSPLPRSAHGRVGGGCPRCSEARVQANHRRRRHGGNAGGLARRQGRRVRGARRAAAVKSGSAGSPAALALQITRDDVDHDYPRWTPDSSRSCTSRQRRKKAKPARSGRSPRLAARAAQAGAGDRPEPMSAMTAADRDLSEDRRRHHLTILDRDGAQHQNRSPWRRRLDYFTPRWSPDDRSIAFIANEGNLQNVIYITDTGERQDARDRPRDVSQGPRLAA